MRLDISQWKRDGLLKLNSVCNGSTRWTRVNMGKEIGSIGYEINTLDADNMWVRLHYTHTPYGGEPAKMDYKIKLQATQPNYGGKRLWFTCPLTNKRTGVLYSTAGSKWFASRHAYSLKYASQSRGAHDRAIDRMWKLKNRLGGEYYWIKPKGMHQKTYERKLNDLFEAEQVCEKYLLTAFQLR